jgi:hypothetical protein
VHEFVPRQLECGARSIRSVAFPSCRRILGVTALDYHTRRAEIGHRHRKSIRMKRQEDVVDQTKLIGGRSKAPQRPLPP